MNGQEKALNGEENFSLVEELPERDAAAPETVMESESEIEHEPEAKPESESGTGPQPESEAAQQEDEEASAQEDFAVEIMERLELELWRAGIRQPQRMLGQFDLSRLRRTADGNLEGFDEQLAALYAEQPAGVALAGSSGNFIRFVHGEKPGLREAIGRFYRR